MKKAITFLAILLTALLMPRADGDAQARHKETIFTVAGHAGEAQLLQVNGKSYVEVETLAKLTQGTLSFKGNQTISTLPAPVAEVQAPASPAKAAAPAPAPHAKPALSAAFSRAGIEEMSMIQEWRTGIVNAVQANSPVAEDWVAAHHSQAEKNLALASAAASTDDDRNAIPLLTAEYNNMQKLSDLYLAMRRQDAFIAPDKFDSSLEQQILSCAQGFVAMTETHQFQDQAACH